MNMHISLPSVIRRKSIPAGLLALLAAGCVPDSGTQVTVENPLPSDRVNEIVEIPLSALGQEAGQENGSTLVVTDGRGKQVPSQITFDGKLIFPASVKAGSSARYQIRKGNPDTLSVIACGRHYPERMDDIAWENDKAAYRAYGPALEASGERAWGYDVFTKSVSEPVVEMRYARELDPQARAKISAWRKEGRKEQADSLAQAISYHVDHGNGMDCYSVGPTLGGGTAALMTADSMLVYPRCYTGQRPPAVHRTAEICPVHCRKRHFRRGNPPDQSGLRFSPKPYGSQLRRTPAEPARRIRHRHPPAESGRLRLPAG